MAVDIPIYLPWLPRTATEYTEPGLSLMTLVGRHMMSRFEMFKNTDF